MEQSASMHIVDVVHASSVNDFKNKLDAYWSNWMPIGLRKKWCITTAQKFQEPETEVLQCKLQKFYTHS